MLEILRSDDGKKLCEFIEALDKQAGHLRDEAYLHELVVALSAVLDGALDAHVQVSAIAAVRALVISDSANLDEADNRVLAELFIGLLRNYGNCLARCMEV
jgi:hypothetical protein